MLLYVKKNLLNEPKPDTPSSMKNFSISVCFFHLNQTLDESLDRVSSDAYLIWENLIQLSEKLPFTELKDLKSKLVCY